MFFNLFAPSTVGGDVTRVYYLAGMERKTGRRVGCLHSSGSRVGVHGSRRGMAVLVWLGAAGLALFPYYAVPSGIRSLTFALSLALIAGGLLVPLLRRFSQTTAIRSLSN